MFSATCLPLLNNFIRLTTFEKLDLLVRERLAKITIIVSRRVAM